MERLACGFQMSLRRRLERSEAFAEPSLAELASHERRLHANATVGILKHEAVEHGVRVKASFVDRQLSKPRLCQRLGAFQAARGHQLEAARTASRRYSPVPAIAPQGLWKEYEQSLDQAQDVETSAFV